MVETCGNLDTHLISGFPLDIWISIGNLETQSQTVENLNTVHFL